MDIFLTGAYFETTSRTFLINPAENEIMDILLTLPPALKSLLNTNVVEISGVYHVFVEFEDKTDLSIHSITLELHPVVNYIHS